MSAVELTRLVEMLARQTSQWTPARWSAVAEPGTPSRAELVYGLIQRIADLAAEVEGQHRREIPPMESPLLLIDQLRVMAADLILAGAPEGLTHAAAADVSEVRALL